MYRKIKTITGRQLYEEKYGKRSIYIHVQTSTDKNQQVQKNI